MKVAPRLIGLLALAAAAMTAALLLPLAEWTVRLAARARETGPLGAAVFFVAYILSTVAGLPGSILTLGAGFAYGPFWGLALASPSSIAGATAAFLLGRTLLRDWAARKVGASAKGRAIELAVARDGFKLVLLLRLSPLFPFNVLNYVLSLSTVRLRDYVAASAIGMLPGTALYVYLGSLAPAAADLSSAAAEGGRARVAIYVIGLLATVLVAVLATRAARRELSAALPEGAAVRER
ncbi:MAG: TVP38/TMEM64 family protein [Acidobacteriota bacterium]